MLRHLDIGCGAAPRNPFGATDLYGLDIREDLSDPRFKIMGADLFNAPIPFEDHFFDSVSAYDFIEHVPRAWMRHGETVFPFVELMNEVWRVLRDRGVFYASTPAYPHPAAFQDPTHVNIITRETHKYFTLPDLMGKMYGFAGAFEVVRVLPCVGGRNVYEPKNKGLLDRFRFQRREWRGRHSHLVWELRAVKSGV